LRFIFVRDWRPADRWFEESVALCSASVPTGKICVGGIAFALGSNPTVDHAGSIRVENGSSQIPSIKFRRQITVGRVVGTGLFVYGFTLGFGSQRIFQFV
jgi:hypothetical protein